MLNYLSAAAQRPSAAWRTKPTSDLIGNLQCLLAAVGASGRGSLFLESTSCPVAELLCEDIDISLRQEQDLLSMRLIEKEDAREVEDYRHSQGYRRFLFNKPAFRIMPDK